MMKEKKMKKFVDQGQNWAPGKLTADAAVAWQIRVQARKNANKIEHTQPECSRVFHIVELLEQVLLHLPIRDLLLSQRVCRKWRALAKESTSIRRALFFEPSQFGPVSYMDWEFDDRGFYNEWWRHTGNLLYAHPLRFPSNSLPVRYKSHWGMTRRDVGLYRVFINPLLAELFPVLRPDGLWSPPTDLAPQVLWKEASWRRMCITQPPVAQLYLKSSNKGNRDLHMAWDLRPIYQYPVLRMDFLYSKLAVERREAWIMGTEDWQEYSGKEDLARVVVELDPEGRKCPENASSHSGWFSSV